MRAHIIPYWRKIAVSLFFVLLFLTLPDNAKVFRYLRASETFSDELENRADLTQNKEDDKLSDSVDNKVANAYCFRLLRNGGTPVKLETTITRFQGDFTASDGTTRPATVDLIGTIHFAEPQYYEELNRVFQEYEVVVFEMVAPRGTDVGKLAQKNSEDETQGGGSILNIVPFVQETLADALGFCYQIEGVDYGAPNLKRGDADVEEFVEKLLSSVDVPGFCLSALFSALSDDSRGKLEGWCFALLCAKDKRLTARRLLALDLEASGEGEFVTDNSEKPNGGDSPDDDDALIAFRNRKALDVVRRELQKGKTNVAVFYGAAHLPDFARRLETDFGMKQTETRWIPAWNMEKE